MVVAEELGVPLERIQIEHADTGTTQYSGPSGGAKTVPVRHAGRARRGGGGEGKLLQAAAEELKVSRRAT